MEAHRKTTKHNGLIHAECQFLGTEGQRYIEGTKYKYNQKANKM